MLEFVLRALVFAGLLAIPGVVLYVDQDLLFPYVTGKNILFRLLVEVVAAAWVVLAMRDPRYRPRFSWLLAAFLFLLLAMFFANLFGVQPAVGFWGNLERMDGYITLLHLFVYFLLLGSVFRNKRQWRLFFGVSLAVALYAAISGFAQSIGEGGAASGRLRGILGNSGFMASYMLLHGFVAAWLWAGSEKGAARLVYAAAAVVFIAALAATGTRGALLGLCVGVLVAAGHVAVHRGGRRATWGYAGLGFAVLVLLLGAWFGMARDEGLADESALSRIVETAPRTLDTRLEVWRIALDGAMERPILGWGQNGFNQVFNAHYRPELHADEQWFDRAHNHLLDWLIAGGVLGLSGYLALFIFSLYYLSRAAARDHAGEDAGLSGAESAVVMGALVGHFVANLASFDTLASYIVVVAFLGLIHARVSPASLGGCPGAAVGGRVAMGAAVVLAGCVLLLYQGFHQPALATAKALRSALSEDRPAHRLALFNQALAYDTFARQEAVEHLVRRAMAMARNDEGSSALSAAFIRRAEAELLGLLAEGGHDARLHLFAAGFYRALGDHAKAASHFASARQLSPRRPAIITQQAIEELRLGHDGLAHRLFEEAYRLDERNMDARAWFAASLLHNREFSAVWDLMDSPPARRHLANSEAVVRAASAAGAFELLMELYRIRVATHPGRAQNWAALAYLHHRRGDDEGAIRILKQGAGRIPGFAPQASCIIEKLRSGSDPNQGCVPGGGL